MEIKDITIRKIYTGSLSRLNIDGEQHRKKLPFLSVVQAIEGEYEIQLGTGKTYRTGTGGVFIAPSRVMQTITHHTDPDTDRMRARWVFLDAVVNRAYLLDSVFRFPVLIPEGKKQNANAIFEDIWATKDPCDGMINGYRLIKLLLAFAESKTPEYTMDFTALDQYISTNYPNKITVCELADLFHMSESNFYLLFKKNFGISPMAYVNNYRLSMASLLLHDPELSIGEIAERVGFCDQFYFSRCFKKMFSVPPGKYRTSLTSPSGKSDREDVW